MAYRNANAEFDFAHAALMVIDMQNDFLLVDAPIQCHNGLHIVNNIQRLAGEFRKHNRPVIYTQEIHRKQKVDFGLELAYEEPEHCIEGSGGEQFFLMLLPEDNDYIIKKRRYSAFFATDLDLLLRGLNVNTLVLTGVATDVCIRATAQDAQQYNYRVLVPQECVAGTSEDAHCEALKNIDYIYGKVISVQDLYERI
ncbi:cysteine hydrolase family protein [Sporomusa sphaeroides]|uniref:Maleamate amidohydrolase n=1 Tax=Sporomusa sphaeroides DSM 2875 TaxID=1337886 RepID=A0ABM9W2T7_9FIRM|nr:isochorismatase family cysteine hydrolase [Sporomusa sphaeroides]OLS56225.1 maleamate amidohydrolase [Sporomusa sphaeroides DSM 2875]CVK19133.1 Maleamate amidohydrolase [Sporomusa sphaeroides DSM 2875]